MLAIEAIKLNQAGKRKIAAAYVAVFFHAAIFFIAAGSMDIPRGWLYFAVEFCNCTFANVVMAVLNPEIINQRGTRHTGTKSWDKLFFLLASVTTLVMYFAAGIELGRGGEAVIPLSYSIAAVFVLAGFSLFTQWAINVNKHFELTARIQQDRAHRVVAAGPYRMIRHPGYVGIIMINLSRPLIMGSVVALIPAGMLLVMFIVRTALEDRMLHKELPGYREYASRVRYRLLYGVW